MKEFNCWKQQMYTLLINIILTLQVWHINILICVEVLTVFA